MRRFLCFVVGVTVLFTAVYHLVGGPVQNSAAEKNEIVNDLVNRSLRSEPPAVEETSFDYIPQPAKRLANFHSPNTIDNQKILKRMFGSGPGAKLADLPFGSMERLISSLAQADTPQRTSTIQKTTQGSSVLRPHTTSKKPRGIAPKTAAQKIQSDLYEGRFYPYAVNQDGTIRLTVRFSDDVTRAEAIRVMQKYGTVHTAPTTVNIFTCSMPESAILDFAGEAGVQRVEPAPPDKEMHMDQSRATINADAVQAAPYNLSGNGVTVAITDGGWVDINHDDYVGRVTIGDAGCTEPDCGTHFHATHVGGILAGDGTLSGGNLRGLATDADIRSYEWPDSIAELDTEMSNAIANGAILSSNSWSWAVSATRANCSIHGDYDLWSERFDEIINGALGDDIVMVCSAGNEENDGDCGPYPWNQINPSLATAKNSITVGAVYSDNLDHTCFSSRGPVDDGRLKPDLVAPGDEGDDHFVECLSNDMIRSTFPGDVYDDIAGTSMSTPMVSGTVALMREQWTILGYPERKPHTYKAVLVQAADDLGNPGPDYTHGHGMLDVQESIDYVIRNYPNNELVRLGWVVDNEQDTVYTSVPCDAPMLRVTLAWDDVPGTVSSTHHLINDLDLYLKSPSGTYHYAYRLDPTNPGNNAVNTPGYNARDNVEVVEVQNPEAGKWMVVIWGWDIPSGSEEYTIVTPYEDINCGDYLYHDTKLGHDLACTGDGLNLNGNGMRFDGCDHHITGDMGAGDYGLWIVNNKNITVVNTRISDFDYGIYMSNADSCVIGAYDSLTANRYGIRLYNSSNANIVGMNWIENNVEHGVSIETSDYNTIGIWNEIDNNKRNVIIEAGADFNYVYGNAIHDGSFYGVLTASATPYPANDSISNNIIHNNLYGIRYYQTGPDNSIFENEIYDNTQGIYMYSTGDLRVYDNNIYSNSWGVNIETLVDGVVMTNNEICTNTSYDIYHTGGANSGNENMADIVYNWADDGQSIGTDWYCSGCRRPEDNLVITSSITICPGTYYIPDLSPYGVLILDGAGITLDCNGAIFDGTGSIGGGEAVRTYSGDNNIVKNGTFRNYPYGIFFTQNANDNIVHDNVVEDCATGIRAYNSYRNTYYNNTVTGGTYGLLLAGASADHYIHHNEFCDNVYDISNEGTATGNDNRCDLAVSYADSGVVANCDLGCTDCEVSPTAINFGTVGVGGVADRTFYITNTGLSELTGTVSEACDHYVLSSGEGPYSLAAGETLWVGIRFKPADYGVHLCTIQTGASCANVSCTGTTPDLVPPSVIVDYPNGGELFAPGDSILVDWTATDNQSVDSVSIYYSADGGGGYTLLAGGEPNTPPFLWMAPAIETDSCLVKVVAFDPGLLIAEDDSDDLFSIRSATGVGEDTPILASELEQNYPNPFNPSTSINFAVVATATVRLKIYDVSGRLVRVLVDEKRDAGKYTERWDGKDHSGRGVASGVYFCRFQAGDYQEIRKMVLLR